MEASNQYRLASIGLAVVGHGAEPMYRRWEPCCAAPRRRHDRRRGGAVEVSTHGLAVLDVGARNAVETTR